MALKFQSEEWFKEANNRIQSDEGVLGAGKGQTVAIQQVVTELPEGGEKKTFLKITDGTPEVGIGEVEGAEATVTQSYETSVAILKGEVNQQAAFMQGKIKIQGNLMKIMSLQGFLQAFGKVLATIETEF